MRHNHLVITKYDFKCELEALGSEHIFSFFFSC